MIHNDTYTRIERCKQEVLSIIAETSQGDDVSRMLILLDLLNQLQYRCTRRVSSLCKPNNLSVSSDVQ